MTEERQSVKQPEGKSGRKTCLKVFLIVFAVFFLLFLLATGGVALALAATGLFEVPVLSKLFSPPPLAEEFSYQTVSAEQFKSKLEALGSASGAVDLVFTDDEVSTIVADVLYQSDPSSNPFKELVVKFEEGVVKVAGTLTQNDAQFYVEVAVDKPVGGELQLDIKEARLGVLPIPSFVIDAVLSTLLGPGSPWENLPVGGIDVSEGSITLTGLDLSGLGGPGE